MIKVIDIRTKNIKLDELAQEVGGFYIKVVVDLEKEILAAGAKMHVDEEQIFLSQGSDQKICGMVVMT